MIFNLFGILACVGAILGVACNQMLHAAFCLGVAAWALKKARE